MIESHGAEKVKEALCKMFREGQILFPLKRYLKDYEKCTKKYDASPTDGFVPCCRSIWSWPDLYQFQCYIRFGALQNLAENDNYQKYFQQRYFEMPVRKILSFASKFRIQSVFERYSCI